MGRDDFVDRVPGDQASREEDKNGHRQGRQRLRAAVPKGMVRVGRPRRHPRPAQTSSGGKNVEQGLDPVGDQRVGVAKDAAGEFRIASTALSPMPRTTKRAPLAARSCAAA